MAEPTAGSPFPRRAAAGPRRSLPTQPPAPVAAFALIGAGHRTGSNPGKPTPAGRENPKPSTRRGPEGASGQLSLDGSGTSALVVLQAGKIKEIYGDVHVVDLDELLDDVTDGHALLDALARLNTVAASDTRDSVAAALLAALTRRAWAD